MEMTTGTIKRPQKVVIYGPEGIGKSTLASQFPAPIFIDVEDGTDQLNITRTPKPTSWTLLMGLIGEFTKQDWHDRKTLVIDTADWASMLCVKHVCASHSKDGIEAFGYGKGFVYLEEEFGRMLNLLTQCRDAGMNIVILAHSQMRKFENPDESGSYDRYEMKTHKKIAALIKEWADMVLFCNYRTFVVEDEDGKKKVQGGARTIYTTHHPCWDAKNRHGLADHFEMKYEMIAEHIPTDNQQAASETAPVAAEKVEQNTPKTTEFTPDRTSTLEELRSAGRLPEDLLPLHDLMLRENVTTEELQAAVGFCGYYPKDTPIENYDPEFVAGKLIANWGAVVETIKTKIRGQ